MVQGPFRDRLSAGLALGQLLLPYRDRRPLVVGLPRGGVVVAVVVADVLEADLDIAIVRKIGAPGNAELALGAVGEEGAVVRNRGFLAHLDVSESEFEARAAAAAREVGDRVRLFRAGRPPISAQYRCVVLVDDGIATGATAEAAVQIMRARGAAEVVVAAPVAAPEAVNKLARIADDVVCVDIPARLGGVGAWYDDFTQVSDREVIGLLQGPRT